MDKKNKKAILSVSDKTGIVEFAKGLIEFGYIIYSTGGTLKSLLDAGINAVSISELTAFPEILEGRVKTLHPAVFAGILAKRNSIEHLSTLEKHNLSLIDLVAVNLYPFEKVTKNPDISLETAIENIDIGGPSILRAASKNFFDVTAVVDPLDYTMIINEMRANNGEISIKTRAELVLKVFKHTSHYDSVIAEYLSKTEMFKDSQSSAVVPSETKFPEKINISFNKVQDLRYGENNHQKAAFYVDPNCNETSIAKAKQLHGKELSYNNICDLETALEFVKEFQKPAAVILKHANPCGAAIGEKIASAYKKALACDPVSAFGGIIGLNRNVDEETAKEISTIFTEAVIAPSYSGEALNILKQKKNIRLLETGNFTPAYPSLLYKGIVGGMLVSDRDVEDTPTSAWKVVTEKKPTQEDLEALEFAWKVVKWVKSNAIVFTGKDYTIGIGAGQMSRVDSVKIAVMKAQSSLKNSYLGSDAFFPMRDGIDEAAKAGVKAIVQPGGSIKDEEVIKAANEHGIIMLFTGIRHFRH